MSGPARTVLPPLARSARPARAAPLLLPNKTLPNAGGTSMLSRSDINRLPPAQRPKCLLVHVPITVLPTDVHRALREVGAAANFSLGSCAPRKAGLQMQYHITAPSAAAAENMYTVLSRRPLFASGSQRVGPAAARPVLGADGVRHLASVGFCALESREWAEALLRRAEKTAQIRGGTKWDQIDVDWAINPALSGRRVLLRGLPGMEARQGVDNLVRGYAEDGRDAIKRLPPQPWSNVSSWAITCPNVSRAYDLASALNANYFLETVYGTKFPMRANVVW